MRPPHPVTNGIVYQDVSFIVFKANRLSVPFRTFEFRIIVGQVGHFYPVTRSMTKICVIQCPDHVRMIPGRTCCTYSTTILLKIGIFLCIVIGKSVFAVGSFNLAVFCKPGKHLPFDFQSGCRTNILTGIITVEHHVKYFFVFRQGFILRLMQVPNHILGSVILVNTETLCH